MTTAMTNAPSTAHPAGKAALRVTWPRVLLSEWIKFRSLRSMVWTLLTAVVLSIVLDAVFAAVSGSHTTSPAARASFNPVTTSLDGIIFAQLAVGVLGVLMISGEYSTGMIRSSLTVVPRRLPVLWAKLAVFAGVVFPVMLVTSFVSFFIGQALLSSHHLNVAISAPGALHSVFGAALYPTIAGLTGLALGGLLRNTAAGISAFAGVFFVLSTLASVLPSSLQAHFAQYLPFKLDEAVYGNGQDLAHPLAPWVAFGVLCGYAVILTGLAAWRLRRADA
jgi:ABC-2 type transport system permease protein